MKRLQPYRFSLFLLLLLGSLLLGQGASAQVGDPDKVLKTEKQKKKPRKKKRDDPDHSPRDRVLRLWRPARKIDHEPGAFTPKNKPKKDELNPRPELNGDKSLTEKVRKKKKAEGTVFQGNVKVKKKSAEEPGQVYNEEDRLKKRKRKELNGTTSEGNISVKRKNVDQPGVVYNQEDRAKASKRQKLPGTAHEGSVSVKKSDIVPRGTHHAERNQKAGERYSSYGAARHSGNKTVKAKYVREPGVHWSERKSSFAKQYKSTAAASYGGSVPAMSKREKTRRYAQISEQMHQHEGSMKVSKRDADMHPSVVARKAVNMRSAEQKDKARKRSRWYNRIFKNNDQPSSVKAKDRKPRYDKGESEIWHE